jgi:GNAT superfamily N-acetyltransferase
MALWRIRATVDDRPGYLSVLTASLALKAVNILAVQVHTTEVGAVDDFLVDAPDSMSESDLLAAVAKGRGRNAFVSRAQAQGLADQPTFALALAGRLVHDPDTLGDALINLLDAAEVRWRPDPPADRPGFDAARMLLADPSGGSFEVLRPQPAFTPAEFARAQALVKVAASLIDHQSDQATLLLPDGAEVLLRPATREDLEEVRTLHERSSTETVRRRYLGGGRPADARLAQMLEPARGRTLLAIADGRVIAMANLLAEGDLGEVALLVEDKWQRLGLGTALLRRLMAFAERGPFAAVIAHIAVDNVPMLHSVRRLGAGQIDRDGSMLSFTLTMPRHRPVGDETPATFG